MLGSVSAVLDAVACMLISVRTTLFFSQEVVLVQDPPLLFSGGCPCSGPSPSSLRRLSFFRTLLTSDPHALVQCIWLKSTSLSLCTLFRT